MNSGHYMAKNIEGFIYHIIAYNIKPKALWKS